MEIVPVVLYASKDHQRWTDISRMRRNLDWGMIGKVEREVLGEDSLLVYSSTDNHHRKVLSHGYAVMHQKASIQSAAWNIPVVTRQVQVCRNGHVIAVPTIRDCSRGSGLRLSQSLSSVQQLPVLTPARKDACTRRVCADRALTSPINCPLCLRVSPNNHSS
jgi:hypothetical protein